MPGKYLINRGFTLLSASQALTDLAEQVVIVGIAYTLVTAHGGADLGLVMAVWAVPRGLLLLFGGAIADRMDKRRLGSQCGLALTAVTLLAAYNADHGLLALWFGIALLLGVLDALRLPVGASLIPFVVPSESLVDANKWTQAREWLTLSVGPIGGGALIALWGPTKTMVIAAAAYLLSSALLWAMGPVRASGDADDEPTSLLQDVRMGLRYVVREPRLRLLLPFFAAANLFLLGAILVGVPVYVVDGLDAGATGLGTMTTCYGVGMLLGTLATSLVPDRLRSNIPLVFGLFMLSDLFLALVPLGGTLLTAAAAFGVSGLLAGPAATLYRTLLQQIPSENYIGRVSSIARAASFGLEPVSTSVVGGLSARFSARTLLLLTGGVAALVDAVGLVTSRRTLPPGLPVHRPEAPQSPAESSGSPAGPVESAARAGQDPVPAVPAEGVSVVEGGDPAPRNQQADTEVG